MHVSKLVELPPVQSQPDSILQVKSHPSPIDAFPSSQPSVPTRRASPQIEFQEVGGLFETFETQLNPTSIAQLLSQPSLTLVFPSSHGSLGIMSMPSPQIGVQVSAVEGFPPVQPHPDSIIFHVESHPSPFDVLASSQVSVLILYPSPQIGSQAESGVFAIVVTQL